MARAALDALRAKIQVLEGGPRVERRRVPTGVGELDGLLGGFPEPGLVEVVGPEGSGRVSLVLSVLANCTQLVAWVDPLERLNPAVLPDYGVAIERVLIVRPSEDGSSPWAWATEQLLRSGCFRWVVVDLPPRTGSRRSLAHTWARAAEYGRSTGIVLGQRPTRELPADVRLSVGEGQVFVMRDRGAVGANLGKSASVPRRTFR